MAKAGRRSELPALALSLAGLALVCALVYGGLQVSSSGDKKATPSRSAAETAPTAGPALALLASPTLAPTVTPIAETALPVEVQPSPPTEEPPALLQSQPQPSPTENVPPPPVANGAPPAPPAKTSGIDSAYTSAVLAGINSERSARGLTTLSVNDALQSAAESYAELLTQLHTLSHDANGLHLGGRLASAGFSGTAMGEILWYGGGIFAPDETVAAWLASPGHHDIMLASNFTEAGVACYVFISGPDYETRCVVDFGG